MGWHVTGCLAIALNAARMVVCGCTAAGDAVAVGARAGCHEGTHKLDVARALWSFLYMTTVRSRRLATDDTSIH